MNKRDLMIYRIVTGLFTLMTLLGVSLYIFQHEMAVEMFTKLTYPTYLIYFLIVAKLLGLVAIWTRKSEMLKEWAYAGFVFELILAISAHLNVGDGEFAGAAMVLVLAVASYVYERKVYGGAKG